MNITDIIAKTEKPGIYEKGTAMMWTDQHISKQLLQIHLNPDIDLASRKKTSIDMTARWILNLLENKGKISVLDLGCGPGLYTEIFAAHGHDVTGVDISENSVEYAKKAAKKKNLNINYIHASYLDLELEAEKYDLLFMIFTDLGVLNPAEREKLLSLVYRVLKKGGTFVFDLLKDNEIENKTSTKNWDAAKSGFWKASPYLALSASFLYHEEKVILYQHTIVDSGSNIEVYRFWTHFFSQDDIKKMLDKHHFQNITCREDILPKGDLWNGDNVIFTVCTK